MSSLLRRLTGWGLLALYGGFALLGHSGMHELQGEQHHAHVAVAATDRDAAHPHVHSSCGHCHEHAAAAAHDHNGSDGGHRHHHHGPGHDHDDCLVCQYFAAKAFVFAPPAPLDLAAGVHHAPGIESRLIDGADVYVLPIRGPPATAC